MQATGIAPDGGARRVGAVDHAAQINHALRAMRRRLSMAMFLRHAARGTLFFFAILVVLRGVVWWQGTARPDPSSLPYMLTWPFILGALGGAFLTALRRPSLTATAQILDARGNTMDRLLSARAFSEQRQPTEMQRLALAETSAWLGGRDLRPLAPVRFPRELKWVFVPLAMLALLWWHEFDRAAQRDVAIAAAQQNASTTIRSLEAMAKQVEERAKANNDDELRKIAERLKQSAAQLRAEADRAGDTNTTALRQIAELEQLVKQLRQPERVTPDEVKALAQALAQNEQTKEAAKSMQENRFKDAADALEEIAKMPDARKSDVALREAIEHLARREEQASKQMEQIQREIKEGQQVGGSQRQQLLKQIANVLRQMDKREGPGPGKENTKEAAKQQREGGNKDANDQDLQKLLSALEQMKDKQQENPKEQSGGDEGEEKGKGSGPVTMLSFHESKDAEPVVEIGVPSGKPGSEKDGDSSNDPLGSDKGKAGEAQRQEQLSGQLGVGETLSALMPSAAAGDAKATRRYKELTEAAASAAEESDPALAGGASAFPTQILDQDLEAEAQRPVRLQVVAGPRNH